MTLCHNRCKFYCWYFSLKTAEFAGIIKYVKIRVYFPKRRPITSSICLELLRVLQLPNIFPHAIQRHHHNGDWAARRPQILCSICVHSFGALGKAVRLFIASLHNQPMYHEMRPIDIFVNRLVKILNAGGSIPRYWGLRDNMGAGIHPFDNSLVASY